MPTLNDCLRAKSFEGGGLFKTARVLRSRKATDEVIDWITFYNHRRLHYMLGYVNPMQFEKR